MTTNDRSEPTTVIKSEELERATAASTAKAALASSATPGQELLLDAFEAIPEGIVIYDSEDRLALWNRRYAEIYEELGFSLKIGKTRTGGPIGWRRV